MVVTDLALDFKSFAINGAVAKKSTKANNKLMMSGATPDSNWTADCAERIPPMKIAPGISAIGFARPSNAIVIPSKPIQIGRAHV